MEGSFWTDGGWNGIERWALFLLDHLLQTNKINISQIVQSLITGEA